MKLRNLFVFAVTIAAASLCAQGQESDGSMTFTDHLGQSISISRFGTVLSFKDRKGRENATDHAFRICPSGGNSQCIDSKAPTDETSAELKVKFPEQGETVGKNQTLIVTATVHQGVLTVTRQITWRAGSSVANIEETISASGATGIGAADPASRTIALVIFEESGKGLEVLDKPQTKPPGSARSNKPEPDPPDSARSNKPKPKPTGSARANKPEPDPPGSARANKPEPDPPGSTSSKNPSNQWKVAPGKLELTTELVLLHGQSVSARMRFLVAVTSAQD